VGYGVVERGAQQLRVHHQAGAVGTKGGGHAVAQVDGGAAHHHPGVVQQALGYAASEHVVRGQADEGVGVGAPRYAHQAAGAERQTGGAADV